MWAEYIVLALVVLVAAGYLVRRWTVSAEKGGTCGGCCGCDGEKSDKSSCDKD